MVRVHRLGIFNNRFDIDQKVHFHHVIFLAWYKNIICCSFKRFYGVSHACKPCTALPRVAKLKQQAKGTRL
jgi:hypothetical protein